MLHKLVKQMGRQLLICVYKRYAVINYAKY